MYRGGRGCVSDKTNNVNNGANNYVDMISLIDLKVKLQLGK
jgi:hypothetical protein